MGVTWVDSSTKGVDRRQVERLREKYGKDALTINSARQIRKDGQWFVTLLENGVPVCVSWDVAHGSTPAYYEKRPAEFCWRYLTPA